MPLPNLDHYQQLANDFCSQISDQLLAQIHNVSTPTFGLIVLTICIPPILALVFFEIEASRARAEQPKGCRKLGLKAESNLANEFDKKYSQGRPPSTEVTSAEWWRVKSLWIYPVKSCRGVELNRSNMIATGMEYDRQFSFAEEVRSAYPKGENPPQTDTVADEWLFMTQRKYPLLARVRTEIWIPDPSVEGYTPHAEEVKSGGILIISFPCQLAGWRGWVAGWGATIRGTIPEKQFRVPFDPTPKQAEKSGYKFEAMKIWKDTVRALNMELDLPTELRYFLGVRNKLALFRLDNQSPREVYRCAPRKEELGWQPVTCFQDAYPLHIQNLASVRDVERQIPKAKGSPPLSVIRFRPNIIITGPEAYNEDTWKRIRIGYYEYAVTCRTVRCRLPNVDQTTGEKHDVEPDKTLRTTRNVDLGAGDKLGCLGMQMLPILQEGSIKVGDEVTVLETGEHFYLKQ